MQLASACFNIRSIGSLWSSSSSNPSGGTVASFQYPLYRITLVIHAIILSLDTSPLFQYPLYRITLVILIPAWPLSVMLNVSISALSDHFGHQLGWNRRQGFIPSFNIRSIGSLWSSGGLNKNIGTLLSFQYPLYRITLVISTSPTALNCSLGFQYPLYRITLVIVILLCPATAPHSFQYPLYRITLVIMILACVLLVAHVVSISALSDHFGHLSELIDARFPDYRFNIRSIGSLWSSMRA